MKQFYFLFSVLVAATLCSCSTDIAESALGSIAGSVSDRTTGEPVATVNVSINPGGSSTVTGNDGTFSFRNLDEGSYTLSIAKEGYKQNSSTVTVRPGDPTLAHLLIERIPAIVTADRELLDFGANTSSNTLSFNIVNSGYVDLEWEIEERCDWITEVKPSKGILKYGKTEAIVVVIDREALPAGENETVIVVRSSNGSSEVKVTAIGAERYLPRLNTLEASEITSSSVTLYGEITDAGLPTYTERGFVYSSNSTPTFDNMIAKVTSPVTKDAKYSCELKGLSVGQTYYVRAYATNSVGTAYSTNEINFTTVLTLPTVETLDIVDADIQKGTATFRGSVISAGEPAYSERGFVYGTIPEPTIYDNKVVASGVGVEGAYSVYMKNLPNTTYYVRAYAMNQGGVVYGEQKCVESEWVDLSSIGLSIHRQDIGKGDVGTLTTMCQNSRIGGYTDWRLPTLSELSLLYTNREVIGHFEKGTYWSSTSVLDSYYFDYYYYHVDFRTGESSSTWNSQYQFRGRCVRTINDK